MEIHHGWMSPRSGRGTSDIIYNCLFTIAVCCWSAVHVNLPADNESAIKILLRKVNWMLITLVAPEATATIAFEERVAARILHLNIRKLSNPPPSLSNWTMAHCFLVTMGGVSLRTTQDQHFRIRLEQFDNLLQKNQLEIPEISVKEIKDKSKADAFIKFVALLQILWFVAQIIGRAVQHLCITTIELFTLATVSMTVFTYLLWWQKPQDIITPFVFPTQISIEDIKKGAEWISDSNDEARGLRMPLTKGFTTQFSHRNLLYAYMFLVGTVFATCHIIGWNFYFLTSLERLLWRISSVACLVGPCCFLISLPFDDGHIREKYIFSIQFFGALVHIVVRIYLLVEAIAGLRALPVTAYQTVDWTRFLPHV